MSSPAIIITTSDGVQIPISHETVVQSGFLNVMMDNYREDNEDADADEDSAQPIDVTLECSSAGVNLASEFMTHSLTEQMTTIETIIRPLDPKAPEDADKPWTLADLVQPWFAEFMTKQTPDELIKVANAAHFLDIAPLVQLCCAHIAFGLKDQTPDEIREKFGISNTYSPDEYALREQQDEWVETAQAKKAAAEAADLADLLFVPEFDDADLEFEDLEELDLESILGDEEDEDEDEEMEEIN